MKTEQIYANRLSELSPEELLAIDGGNPAVREILKWAIGSVSWDIISGIELNAATPRSTSIRFEVFYQDHS